MEGQARGLPLCLDDGSVRAQIEALGDPGAEACAELPVARDLRVTLDVDELDTSLPPAEDEDLKLAASRSGG